VAESGNDARDDPAILMLADQHIDLDPAMFQL
jgi:hypothetical protein